MSPTGQAFLQVSILVLAISSLLMNWVAYRRDSGRLDVSVFTKVAREPKEGASKGAEQDGLYFSIVNSQRRPLSVGQLVGDLRKQFFKRWVYGILGHRTPKFLTPSHFVIDHPTLITALKARDENRVLLEGESILTLLPLPDGQALYEYIAKNCSNVYAVDFSGRRHRTSKATMKKLKNDFLKHERNRVLIEGLESQETQTWETEKTEKYIG